MRTRPPKAKRHPSTSEVYTELSGLLVEAGCEPLPPMALRYEPGDFLPLYPPPPPLALSLNVSADVPTLETM